MLVPRKKWPVPQLTGAQGYGAGATKSSLHSPNFKQSFGMIQTSVNSNEIFYLDGKRNAERWQSNTNWREKKINPDEWKVRCGYPWMLVNWICPRFLLLLCSKTLTLIVIDSSLKIEEFLHKTAISLKSGRVKQNCHSPLASWPDRSFSSQCLRWFLDILSLHLCIPVSLPPFHCALWSALGLLRFASFSHSVSHSLSFILSFIITMPTVSLSIVSKTHLQKAFSLHAGALSHSDTFYLNTHMAYCGCHEVLIQPWTTVRFLSNFSIIRSNHDSGSWATRIIHFSLLVFSTLSITLIRQETISLAIRSHSFCHPIEDRLKFRGTSSVVMQTKRVSLLHRLCTIPTNQHNGKRSLFWKDRRTISLNTANIWERRRRLWTVSISFR